ncbi:uncharacterized protein LOC130590219 [Beta vulgaris subsp. vulgaris]|uniref:uncharacterized protein LOC130590219 n=1 Tax=Beta vulgaris subsp. vulgaris TaxID=3555 RepID=UPI0025477927|nr:uncharacterized protein LOC130590219 [Beta vulgaris subsp. vulgaris]
MVVLTETRVKVNNKDKVQRKFGRGWTWCDNYSHHPRRRIWIAWNAIMVHVDVLSSSDQFIHSVVTNKHSQQQYHFTAVYGLHTVDTRRPLWTALHHLSNLVNKEWLITSDFNYVLESSDSINGAPITNIETQDFRELLDQTDLTEVRGIGEFFTWSNKRQGEGDCCMETILPKNLYDIWSNLKNVKMVLKQLQINEFSHITNHIKNAREELDLIQTHIQFDRFNIELHNQEQHTISSLRKWLTIEENVMRQKSRLQWLKLGDSNTKVFYAAMKERQAMNCIDVIYNADGRKLTKPDDIQEEFKVFYSKLMRSCDDHLLGADLSIIRKGPTLSTQARRALITPITLREIDYAMSSIDGDKAPGLDGFNATFFKHMWPVIK